MRKATIGFVMSVCTSVRQSALVENSAPTGRIYVKFHISGVFIRKSVQKIKASWKCDTDNQYFTWRPIYIFDPISLSSA